MLLFLDNLVSTIAPHQCLGCGTEGTLLCSNCIELLPGMQPRCYKCGRTDSGWQTCEACRKITSLQKVYVCTEYEGVSEQLIRALKFERAINAANVVASALAKEFKLHLEESTIVPVPTATSRVRERGYDQSVVIASQFSKYIGLPSSQAFIRYGQQRQTNSSRKERLTQLENAFSVRKGKLKNFDRVLLVDDVLTTSATIEAAARTLRQAGVKQIDALVFARA